jgi:hypothetical protein
MCIILVIFTNFFSIMGAMEVLYFSLSFFIGQGLVNTLFFIAYLAIYRRFLGYHKCILDQPDNESNTKDKEEII